MELTAIWWILALVLLLVDIWAIASVWRTSKSSGTKAGWALLILVLPVIGLAIWGIAGPRGVAEPPTSKEHSKG
ncbi:PLD nuclease N-terminal domain-containing protein [Pseudomonas putida]|uniref:PLD nuclease N-terminal domain-containing protein n=1 Tax=Pseudomonas putida TaxID=303 RepID=UPI002363405B|nr:PLD nuclease N-terminal domain-containing protein [Pseudomonas putida]MDD1967493.1 PLD nuclease N-terminal domain-containing protein [Pseudomonas putida]